MRCVRLAVSFGHWNWGWIRPGARCLAVMLVAVAGLLGGGKALAQVPAAPLPHQGSPPAPGEDVSNSPERFLKVCYDWPYWKVCGKKWFFKKEEEAQSSASLTALLKFKDYQQI